MIPVDSSCSAAYCKFLYKMIFLEVEKVLEEHRFEMNRVYFLMDLTHTLDMHHHFQRWPLKAIYLLEYEFCKIIFLK